MAAWTPLIATLLIAGSLAAATPAGAQQTTPNPLRPAPNLQQTPPAAAPAERKTRTERPRRERSEKQKANDQIMRDCGAAWRADKAALQAKGVTWRSYLSECRAKRRAELRI